MDRLISSGLMYGNLVPVTSPTMVGRYNRALRALTGRETSLTDFHIDISGFSPEVGDDLGDPHYLNHAGVNRQFILLTTEQRTAPLLNPTFSTTRGILRAFIDRNEAALFALTAQDVVTGELVNAVYDLSDARRLFDLTRVTIEADTTGGTLRAADDLAALVNDFKTRPDGWYDDVLIARMIEIARETGDVLRNPVRLNTAHYDQSAFWTAHFGGLYLLRDVAQTAVIAPDAGDLPDLPVDRVIDITDHNRIARMLDHNGLVEPIARARGIDAAGILRQKMDFIVVDVAQETGIDLAGATRADIRKLARTMPDRLPAAWHGLRQLVAWAEGTGDWPRITSDDPAYFYALRAADTPHRDLVNQLLAELAPMDVRQLFICHKALFYRLYAGWSATKRGYVVDFLTREYQVDKAGARAALFGHEPAMAEPPAPTMGPWGATAAGATKGAAKQGGPTAAGMARATDDLIDRVGPWGAVHRKG